MPCEPLSALSSGFVDQLLNFADRRIVNGPNGLAAGWAFYRALETHGLVGDDQLAAAYRAFSMSPDIVEFVRHKPQTYTMRATTQKAYPPLLCKHSAALMMGVVARD
jgi:hypothetical protein